MAKKSRIAAPVMGSAAPPVVPIVDVAAMRSRAPEQAASPHVFISHDSRDAQLADAFGNLLTDASGGVLKPFRSSDKKAGIDYGKEWYNAVMEQLALATDVVALLTQHSIGRPWILFEAGVAKGQRGRESIVFGVTLGVPLEKAISGPFSQFQNSGDSEDELTKVVMQLVRRVPNAEPREEAVRRLVQAFHHQVGDLLKHPAKAAPSDRVEETAVAKLFEEVKVLFRDLPQQVEGKLREVGSGGGRRRRRFPHPTMLEEVLRSGSVDRMRGSDALTWLLFISALREDLPMLYEVGMEVYRALRSRDPKELADASRQFHTMAQLLRRGPPILLELMSVDEEVLMLLRQLPMASDHFLSRVEERALDGKLRGGAKKANSSEAENGEGNEAE